MNILLISRCSQRALAETRRILDQFAIRKGERTWATPVTLEGLKTLRKLLRKSARRNTAVACHRLTNHGSELLWIAGNARRFDVQGNVPTNTSARDVLRGQDENQWHTGEAIALLAGLAGLFHDMGKANQLFQRKLAGRAALRHEPYRHEWLSLRIFQAFVGEQDDPQWLESLNSLSVGDDSALLSRLEMYQDRAPHVPDNPFLSLPPLARIVGWLIVSHHRLPVFPEKKGGRLRPPDLAQLSLGLKTFSAAWNSPQSQDAMWKATDWRAVWHFPKGTPMASTVWCGKAHQFARRMLKLLPFWQPDVGDRFTLHMARLSLMLADHVYSALPPVTRWHDRGYPVFANSWPSESGMQSGGGRQYLDEHCSGVAHHAYLFAKTLPVLRRSLPSITRHRGFQQRSQSDRFRWQDKAYDLARANAECSARQGFFGVNMASTGCGKTFANARIMYGLANDRQGCRFSVALGLRTLTLQTGDALAARLKLEEDDLAVMVGSSAVRQLHERHQHSPEEQTGSESSGELLDDQTYVHYDGTLDDGALSHWLKGRPALHQLLSAPVLVSTIDHLMPATEGVRGGRQIAPELRLLTSDLVLDEPDEFGLADLPALCRLVNWAGQCGSRVLLSSATLPPSLLHALFDAYSAGRKIYNQACAPLGVSPEIVCAWFDETCCHTHLIPDLNQFKTHHHEFVNGRICRLSVQHSAPVRRASLLAMEPAVSRRETVTEQAAKTVHQAILRLHKAHHQYHPLHREKTLSVGLVRMANIRTLVAFSQVLLSLPVPEDTQLSFCVYHSRYPLLVRSEMEQRLDIILSRHNPDAIWSNPDIVRALTNNSVKNHIFVVFASPVAEVGRDHDYDWAIAEPSSVRSLVQIAGRIQRHRVEQPCDTNMLVLSHNLNALNGNQQPAYCHPGYESGLFRLASPDLHDSFPLENGAAVDATPAIQFPQNLHCRGPFPSLASLEHAHLHAQMFGLPRPSEEERRCIVPACSWWQSGADLFGEMQRRTRFRHSQPDETLAFWQEDEDTPLQLHRLEADGTLTLVDSSYLQRVSFTPGRGVRPWFDMDMATLLEQVSERFSLAPCDAARRFLQVQLPVNERNNLQAWCQHPDFGIYRILGA